VRAKRHDSRALNGERGLYSYGIRGLGGIHRQVTPSSARRWRVEQYRRKHIARKTMKMLRQF
jgi:hypothetical protein